MSFELWWPIGLVIAVGLGVIFGIALIANGKMWRRAVAPLSEPVAGRAAELLAAGLLPLVDCPRDQKACLRCLQVDRCVVHRLLELGLTPGVELRVVQDSGGPMLVSVRGSRVALGRELAENLWVEMESRPA